MKKPNMLTLKIVADNNSWVFKAFTLPDTNSHILLLSSTSNGGHTECLVAENRDEMHGALLGFLYGDSYGDENRICCTNHQVDYAAFAHVETTELTKFHLHDLEEVINVLELDVGWVDVVIARMNSLK